MAGLVNPADLLVQNKMNCSRLGSGGELLGRCRRQCGYSFWLFQSFVVSGLSSLLFLRQAQDDGEKICYHSSSYSQHMSDYDHKSIESKWKQIWRETNLYKTPDATSKSEKYYVLDMFPYPSGAGLHVGHVEGYTATDIVARFMRMQGKAVLHPMGWDAFGLPAENYAIKTGEPPEKTTDDAIRTFKSQMDNLGLSYDWERELGTHKPDYYKFTQWFFLELFKAGLAYRKNAPVNWCPKDQTVLANEQVVDGKCERCDSEVIQKDMEQWFFKITDYADRLLEDLDKINWPESTKLGQVNWIGKSQGINITYKIEGQETDVTIFTTRPDTNFGATFIVLAPDSKFVKENIENFPNKEEVAKYVAQTAKRTELERLSDAKKKTGVFTGWYAINNLNNKKLPIYLSDFALATVGTGALVGVPGHDMRDFDFAQAMGIEIIRVVVGPDKDDSEITRAEQVQEEAGTMINSGFLDGMEIMAAKEKIMDYIEEKGWGKRVTNYRLRDWLVSRQRFWGAPIPIVYDPEGKPHPVDEADLPVVLPTDVGFLPTGESPLKYSKSFNDGVEEKYGKGWRREVDTMDTFVDSSWYFFRFADPQNEKEFAATSKLNSMLPVDMYVGGAEHTVLHLLYSRFFTKFLFDQKYIDFDEPFMKLRHPGMILAEDSRKMSKRWGNVINPDDEIAKFGADTVRMYEMFMGPFKDSKPWSTRTEQGIYRFIHKIWDQKDKVSKDKDESQIRATHKLADYVGKAVPEMQLNTCISKFMEVINEWNKQDKIDQEAWERFLITLAPFAPFLTEELWSLLGKTESIHKQMWPTVDTTLLVESEVTIGIQINGKLRADLTVDVEISEEEIKAKVVELPQVQKWTEGKEIRKFIYVKGKIVNIVV